MPDIAVVDSYTELFCVYSGEYHCPVLNKVFTEFTHIVAVRTTGNVFCYEVCLNKLFSGFWISWFWTIMIPGSYASHNVF